MFSITNVCWLAGAEGEGGKKGERKGDRDGTSVEGGAGVADDFRSFVVCSGSALEYFAVMCLEGDVGMFAEACLTELEIS